MNWYCLRSQLKREPLAATSLRQLEAVEVFYPRLRRKKALKSGAAWVTESLFPNYLFARFDLDPNYRAVKYARGVSKIVQFGEKYAVVPDQVIAELRQLFGEEELHEVPDDLDVGDEVSIVEGPFQGTLAVITRIKLGSERVKVFFDFLGRKTETELPRNAVLGTKEHPLDRKG